MKLLKKYWLLLSLITIIILMALLWNTLGIEYGFENFAKWAYPEEENRNGKVLQLTLNILAGIAILYGLYVSHRRAKAMELGVEKQGEALEKQNTQIELTRKAQIDERFKNAIEHLSSDKEPVILGGIAELHQIALENPDTYSEVVFNILCSYIRSNAYVKNNAEKINRTANQTIINYLFKSHNDDNYPYHGHNPDLSSSNLLGVDMDGINLNHANFSFCILPHIKNAVFTNCEFIKANFVRTEISNIKFNDCNFYSAFFHASRFKNIEFKQEIKSIFSLKIIDSELESVNFNLLKLDACQFIGCEFKNCSFNDSKINGSTFIGSSFKKVEFSTSLIKRCDFRASGFSDVIMDAIVNISWFNGCDNEFEWFRYNLEKRLKRRLNQEADFAGVQCNISNFSKCDFSPLTEKDYKNIMERYDLIKEENKHPMQE